MNLENLYGDGQIGHPFLFQREDPAKFLLGTDGRDLQRNIEGTAIKGDPRNDSHIIISQMHLAMLRAHNTFVDELRAGGLSEEELFDEAVRELTWHYQYSVLHEFLPEIVGSAYAKRLVEEGPHWFDTKHGTFIPIEFADAAFRYGHSQIRHRYKINAATDGVPLFPDLLGFRSLPPQYTIDWSFFFSGVGAGKTQKCKKIDGKLVRSLIELPIALTGECEIDVHHSLAVRDLERGLGVALPSGEAVAREIGVEPLRAAQIGVASLGWSGETPLWFYIQRESDVYTGGSFLGPVGGLIVGEVLVGLIDADEASYRNVNPSWSSAKSLLNLLQPEASSA